MSDHANDQPATRTSRIAREGQGLASLAKEQALLDLLTRDGGPNASDEGIQQFERGNRAHSPAKPAGACGVYATVA